MLRAVVLVLVASLLVVSPTVAAPTASAAGPSSVTLEGRGHGHGRGMSQWGAQEAASEHGRTYRQILAFYYPGLEVAPATGRIRVLISHDTTDDVVVRHRRGLRVRAVATGKSWALDRSGAQQWRLTAAAGGATQVSVLTDRWRAVRTVPGTAEFRARRGALALLSPGRSTDYLGALRSAPGATGGRDTVNVVRLDAYLRGVLPSEVYPTWHPQALQAQAVAARTYAAYHRAHPRSSQYDICDTTSCQVYGGLDDAVASTDDAIRATAGEVLLRDGEPAFTEFSSSNGGWTVASDIPYQVAKQDPWDPVNPWRETLTDNEIEAEFPTIGDFQRLRVRRRDGNGAWNGRVLRIRVVGSRDAVAVSGDEFRSRLVYSGVKSTWFRQA